MLRGHRSRLGLLVALFSLACRRRPEARDAAAELDAADAPATRDADPGRDAPAPDPCTLEGVETVASLDEVDASVSRWEALDRVGSWALAVDGVAGALRLWQGSAPRGSLAVGLEHSDPRLGVSDAGAPWVAWVRHDMQGRRHLVRWGQGLDLGCEQAEGRDEGLTLDAVELGGRIVVVWDEVGPEPAAGRIFVQAIARAQMRPVNARGVAGLCPAPRLLSPQEQDASDPIITRVGPGAAVFWLTARDVETGAGEHNETLSDLWAQGLNDQGVAVGRALRITHAVGHRFGLAAASAGPERVYLAWRNAPDSDSEARGDGGELAVALIAVDRGALARVVASSLVTTPGAVPSGAPAVRADREGAAVFWRERREGAVATFRRRVDLAGRPEGAPVAVPSLGDALPLREAPAGDTLMTLQRREGRLVARRFRCR